MRLFLFLTIILISFISPDQDIQTADEIWQKYLDSYGNKKAALKAKTLIISAKCDTKYGKRTTLLKLKYPDKLYMEILMPTGEKFITIVNGEKGVSKSLYGDMILSNKVIAIHNLTSHLFPDLHYKKLDYEIELLESEKEENNAYYYIEAKTAIGSTIYLINKKDSRVFKTILNNDVVTEPRDYIEVDGIFFPKTIISYSLSDTTDKMIFYNHTYKINNRIDDKIFEIK